MREAPGEKPGALSIFYYQHFTNIYSKKCVFTGFFS